MTLVFPIGRIGLLGSCPSLLLLLSSGMSDFFAFLDGVTSLGVSSAALLRALVVRVVIRGRKVVAWQKALLLFVTILLGGVSCVIGIV